jgi:hypothetical protein
MTRSHGEALARRFGEAHEDFPGNPPAERAMDLHNNTIGRGIGGLPAGPRPLADQINDEVIAGRLRWLP